jgi:hypothetical protein
VLPVLHNVEAGSEGHPSYIFDAAYRVRGTLSLANKAAFGMFEQAKPALRHLPVQSQRLGAMHGSLCVHQPAASRRCRLQPQAAPAFRRPLRQRAVVKIDACARERIIAALARRKAAPQVGEPADSRTRPQRWYRIAASSRDAAVTCIVLRGRAFLSSRRLENGSRS